MINTHLKFEAKIPKGSKVVAFARNYTKFLSLKALKVKVKVTSFQTSPSYLMINEQFKCKGKFQAGQFKSLKQIFCKFEFNVTSF